MVTDNTSQLSGLFGVYLQAGDLDRSLSFYRDVLALEVVWNDSALAVLHSHRAPADSLVIRAIGKAARHEMGEAGVTRVLWRVGDPTELDSAEELLASSRCLTGGTMPPFDYLMQTRAVRSAMRREPSGRSHWHGHRA